MVAPPAGGARYAFGTIYPSDTIYKYDMFRCAKRDLIGKFPQSGNSP